MKKYVKPEIEVSSFSAEDVITTSGYGDSDTKHEGDYFGD